ncbi:MAG TPA: STAS domain-containing protein [Candidatus Baltobacteraceae bacterium]|nr:STAS domain-containing protein [Candidatus Baltobacteraceae bacterium]
MGTRLTLRGDYDIWRREELREELERADLTGDVTIDMSGTTLIDAGSAALLISLRHRLTERTPDARVVLRNAPRIVKRVLQLCGATNLFVFADDR